MADEIVNVPSEEEIETAGSEEAVSPLDPDFLLILFFAMFADLVGGVLAIAGILTFFTVSTLVSIILNVFFMAVISIWMYWRVNRIAESKRRKVKALQKRAQQLSRTASKATARQLQRAGAKVGTKIATRLLLKIASRGALAAIGSSVPIFGVIPFWSISVLFTLKEK